MKESETAVEEKLTEWADSWVQNLGPWGYAVLAGAAFIEYIFPPFPGDSVVALGGAWAWRTAQSWWGVWVMVTLGNVLGIGLQHRLGCALAQKTQGKKPGWVLQKLTAWGLTEARIATLQARIRKRGTALLLLNRFLPSLRALVFLAAGASGLSLKKTLCWGALGSLVWSAFILGLGAWVGGNAEYMLTLLKRYQTLAVWTLGTAIALWVVYRLLKRKKQPP